MVPGWTLRGRSARPLAVHLTVGQATRRRVLPFDSEACSGDDGSVDSASGAFEGSDDAAAGFAAVCVRLDALGLVGAAAPLPTAGLVDAAFVVDPFAVDPFVVRVAGVLVELPRAVVRDVARGVAVVDEREADRAALAFRPAEGRRRVSRTTTAVSAAPASTTGRARSAAGRRASWRPRASARATRSFTATGPRCSRPVRPCSRSARSRSR